MTSSWEAKNRLPNFISFRKFYAIIRVLNEMWCSFSNSPEIFFRFACITYDENIIKMFYNVLRKQSILMMLFRETPDKLKLK